MPVFKRFCIWLGILSVLLVFGCVPKKVASFPRNNGPAPVEKPLPAKKTEDPDQKIERREKTAELAELQARNAYLSHKTDNLQLEVKKRDTVIQLQENVIKLLDDPENTIETNLKNEIQTTLDEMENAKTKRMIFQTEELFISRTYDISKKGQKTLLAFAASIRNNEKQKICIEGHTDNVPVNSSANKCFPSNWEVSLARSAAVARFLQTRAGIKPERLVVVGHGAYKPVASNQTEEGRRRNRRVEIILGPPL